MGGSDTLVGFPELGDALHSGGFFSDGSVGLTINVHHDKLKLVVFGLDIAVRGRIHRNNEGPAPLDRFNVLEA